MQTQTQKRTSRYPQWIPVLEMFFVFTPAIILVELTTSWVGKDVSRSFIIIWIAYAVMLAIIWANMKIRKMSWKELGLTFGAFNSKSALKTLGLSFLVFICATIAFISAPAVASLIVEIPEVADFSRYEFLRDNLTGLILSLAGVYVVSSFGEELIFRAFLIDRISEVFGNKKYSQVVAVILSSVFFGLIHFEWGFLGIVQSGFMGLVMGTFYVKLGRKFWVLVLAHAYMDTILFVQLYMVSNS